MLISDCEGSQSLGVPLNHPFWVGFSTINHRAIGDPLFMNDVLGPKVTWAVMLLDFASRFPDLPEWQVTQNLHRPFANFILDFND